MFQKTSIKRFLFMLLVSVFRITPSVKYSSFAFLATKKKKTHHLPSVLLTFYNLMFYMLGSDLIITYYFINITFT